MRTFAAVCSAAFAGLALAGAANAQSYPVKPVRIVVPVAPGGLASCASARSGSR